MTAQGKRPRLAEAIAARYAKAAQQAAEKAAAGQPDHAAELAEVEARAVDADRLGIPPAERSALRTRLFWLRRKVGAGQAAQDPQEVDDAPA